MISNIVILNGVEAGIEIVLEPEKIYSIGNGDSADFYLQSPAKEFLVFFKLSGQQVQWWSNKKTQASFDDIQAVLSYTIQDFASNSVVAIAGRRFGVYTSVEALESAKKNITQTHTVSTEAITSLDSDSELEAELEPLAMAGNSGISGNSARSQTQAKVSSEPGTSSTSTESSVVSNAANSESDNGPDSIQSIELIALEEPPVKSFFSANRKSSNLNNNGELAKKNRKKNRKTKDKLLHYAKVFPFILGVLIAIGYGVVEFSNKNHAQLPTTVDANQDLNDSKDNKDNKAVNSQNDLDQPLKLTKDSEENKNKNVIKHEYPESPTKQTDLFVSGSEYRTSSKDWDEVKSIPKSNENQLELLRNEISNENFDKTVAKEILFPDEKMMTLIKELLDSAGAQGIDVRFDRGSYDVFGFVRDDSKWQRIFKILTFDLDLTKVQFSVETSSSLLKKFESLLQKFNLSNYVVLSLAPSGEIFAKTYYPPALEGLWMTIVNRFEGRYGQYTNIREYRAHIGWIKVVKVSFGQPSYILLGDGRRIVEGSVLGGDTVLDRIYMDSIRVTSASNNIRYYVINQPTPRVPNELSALDSGRR